MGKLTISMAIKRLPEGSSTVQNRAFNGMSFNGLKTCPVGFNGDVTAKICISMGLQHLNNQW